MKQYLDALKQVLEHGTDRKDRTGVGTRAIFGMQLRFRMKDGCPRYFMAQGIIQKRQSGQPMAKLTIGSQRQDSKATSGGFMVCSGEDGNRHLGRKLTSFQKQ